MTRVTLDSGEQGTIEADSPLAGRGKALVRLDTGRQIIVPENALIAGQDGDYRLPFTATELQRPSARDSSSAEDTLVMARPQEEQIVVPVIAETLQVGKRTVVTGGVRLTKQVSAHEETVDEPLLREEVRVIRVPINKVVTEAPEARYEADTLIVPVLEEILVVEKRLVLKEEIHIQRTQTEAHAPQQITVRREDVVLEEIAPDEPQS